MFKQVALSAPMSTLAFVRAVVLVVVSALLHQCDSFAGGNIDIAGQQLATVHITQQVFVGDSSCSGSPTQTFTYITGKCTATSSVQSSSNFEDDLQEFFDDNVESLVAQRASNGISIGLFANANCAGTAYAGLPSSYVHVTALAPNTCFHLFDDPDYIVPEEGRVYVRLQTGTSPQQVNSPTPAPSLSGGVSNEACADDDSANAWKALMTCAQLQAAGTCDASGSDASNMMERCPKSCELCGDLPDIPDDSGGSSEAGYSA